MKIMFVASTLSGRGGIETMISLIFEELTKLGDRPHLSLFSIPNNIEWADSFKHSISIMQRSDYKPERLFSFGYFKRFIFLFDQIKSVNPDVVVVLPTFLVLYCRIVMFFARKMSIPICNWRHFSIDNERTKLAAMCLKLADKHLCISSGILRQIKRISKCDDRKLALIYNGLPLVNDIIPRSSKKATFIYVGRLMRGGQKRTDDFLRALSMLKGDWRAKIVGDGADRSWLENYANELNISDRITWYGWQSEPWSAIDEASILVQTSSYEGFSMVLIEALSRGIPVISSDCETGPEDIIIPDVNGWIYKKDDIMELVDYMQSMIENPSQFNPLVVKKSAKRFSIDKVAFRMRKALQQSVKRKKRI